MQRRVVHPISPGRIVWAVAPSGRGEGKKRPLIIATRRVDILKGSKIAAIGCSTEFDEPLTPSEMRLPHDPDGKVVTGLRQATVAICDWLEEFPAGSVFETGGMVPGTLLRLIFETAGVVVPPEVDADTARAPGTLPRSVALAGNPGRCDHRRPS